MSKKKAILFIHRLYKLPRCHSSHRLTRTPDDTHIPPIGFALTRARGLCHLRQLDGSNARTLSFGEVVIACRDKPDEICFGWDRQVILAGICIGGRGDEGCGETLPGFLATEGGPTGWLLLKLLLGIVGLAGCKREPFLPKFGIGGWETVDAGSGGGCAAVEEGEFDCC